MGAFGEWIDRLGLEETDPQQTYLDGNGYERCWIGLKWDVAQRGALVDVYRKGNCRITVGSLELALAIVEDDS